MSLRSLEAQILAELRRVTGERTLRQKDIMEWSTSKIEPQDGESYAFLPDAPAHVCYVSRKKSSGAPPPQENAGT